MDTRMIFGRNLTRLRAAKGVSQVWLSNELGLEGVGVSQSYISQLEAGKRDPKLLTLVAIAHALDVTVSEIVKDCEKGDVDRLREKAHDRS